MSISSATWKFMAYSPNRNDTSGTPLKVALAGAVVTMAISLIGFAFMYSAQAVGASLLLAASLAGGVVSGLLGGSTERGVVIGAVTTVIGISVVTFGLFAVYVNMGILVIWPWGIFYTAVTGAIGGYLGCRLRRLVPGADF